ncbi:MAG TPA: hypothetical protein VGB83_01450 [Actinomycetota bacterium]
MKARDDSSTGLRSAHDRIEALKSDLDETIEQVKRLTDEGDDREALRLIDLQREELVEVIQSVSQTVAVDAGSDERPESADLPTLRQPELRWHAPLVASFALIAVVVTVVAGSRATLHETADLQLERARLVIEPGPRLQALLYVYEIVRELEPADAMRAELLGEIEDSARDVEDEGEPSDRNLLIYADRAADDLSHGETPSGPPPSPPLPEEIQELLGQ